MSQFPKKSRVGAEPVDGYVEIYRASHGFVTQIFDLALEQFGELATVRLRTQQYNGAGRSGIARSAFDWPLSGAGGFADMRAMTEMILAAAHYTGEPDDPRGPLRKWGDRLRGRRFIQQLTQLARVDTPKPRRIRAQLYQQRKRVYVLLHHDVSRGPTTTLRLPIEAIEAWQAWLLSRSQAAGAG